MKRMRVIAAALCLGLTGASAATAQDKLIFEEPELVGISGFRTMWDVSVPLAAEGAIEFTDPEVRDQHPTAVWHPSKREGKPGPIAIDALNRRVLVRFPGAAERIAERLSAGASIEKVQLILPYRDHELWPQHGKDFWDPQTGGYTARRNWGVDKMYRAHDPNWHVIGWALRRPWSAADPDTAPTWNAFINGAGYWDHSGAQDDAADRFATRFGPSEVSSYEPIGQMDVTEVVNDESYGKTLGERLRVLTDNGFVLAKWETYDHRYFNGVYEWATATGGRAILLQTPKLVVHFKDGGGESVSLPEAQQIDRLAAALKASGEGGEPHARLMSEEELLAFNEKVMSQPDWMPDWQWQRVREVRAMEDVGKQHTGEIDQEMFFDIFLSSHVTRNMYGKFVRGEGNLPAPFYERYKAWVDGVLARQPRGWSGFEAAKEMAQYYSYGEALPEPAKDAIKTYWTGWLMPDRENAPPNKHRDQDHIDGGLIHPMADQLAGKKKGGTSTYVTDTYWEKTGDWRGNKSFYRAGFNWTISTQNFNTSASAGALLGGAIIDAPIPMADGRHGFQNFPLGLWSWRNGSSQEHIDHYYYSITLSGNKTVADFGPTQYDRVLGRSVVAYNLEELTAAWHPALKRFIAPSSRTSLEHMLVTTDGIQFIMHTLSKDGALFDFDQEQTLVPGSKLIGHEVAPAIIALQAMPQPWAPLWTANLVDDKPIPYHATHKNDQHWRRAYLGRHFGLATIDTAMPRIQIMGHWRAKDQPVKINHEVRLMDVRFGFNETRFHNTGSGHLGRSGQTAALQHVNKMIVLGSPFKMWNNDKGVGFPGDGSVHEVNSLQTSIALFNLEPEDQRGWRFHVDGQAVTSLPVTAKQGQVITVQDGVTYLGIIPLESADLGRDTEVSIHPGQTQEWSKIEVTPTVVIDNYFFRRDEPLAHGRDDFEKIDAAHGGFYIEFADAEDFDSFEAFQSHMAGVAIEQAFDADQKRHAVTVRSGDDVIEASIPTVNPDGATGGVGGEKFVRQINGGPAYPADGILRDTSTSQAGEGGQLAKGGATLRHRAGASAYLQHEPITGTFRAMIPTPKGSMLDLTLPGERRLRTDGRVNLFDVIVHPDGAVEVFHENHPNAMPGDNFATVLVIEGLAEDAKVSKNGEVIEAASVKIDGKPARVVPINHKPTPDADKLAERLAAAAADTQ